MGSMVWEAVHSGGDARGEYCSDKDVAQISCRSRMDEICAFEEAYCSSAGGKGGRRVMGKRDQPLQSPQPNGLRFL